MAEGSRPDLMFRDRPVPGDPEAIRKLVRASGVFSGEEVEVAGRLCESTIDGSVPFFWCFAECEGRLAGYTCFDRIELTEACFDLYWIAVSPELERRGIGRQLIGRTVAAMQAFGGSQLFAETSSRPSYRPARSFYVGEGFIEVARFEDFYSRGDDKIVYRLRLDEGRAGRTSVKAGQVAG